MAAALQSFRFTARSCCCQRIAHRYTTKAIGRRRTFSSTPFRRRENEDEAPPPELSRIEEKADKDYGGSYRKYLEADLQTINEEYQEAMDQIPAAIEQGSAAPEEIDDIVVGRRKRSFLNMGETEDFAEEEDNDDAPDISSIAHGELEAHREKRHYARLAAWEMPLLSSKSSNLAHFQKPSLSIVTEQLLISILEMAKPFEPPTADMPLRFRYTTYMGEQHPSEKKVVLEFCPRDMPLKQHQKQKLKKLVGVRYNPETGIVKMSCEMFESQAQNKRYLGDRVDELLKEARVV
jgi:small subunit ribosomal protein S35